MKQDFCLIFSFLLAWMFAPTDHIARDDNPTEKDKVAAVKQTAPDFIVEKSNQFIISKVGKIFFSKYITIDYDRINHYTPDKSCTTDPVYCEDDLTEPFYQLYYIFKK